MHLLSAFLCLLALELLAFAFYQLKILQAYLLPLSFLLVLTQKNNPMKQETKTALLIVFILLLITLADNL